MKIETAQAQVGLAHERYVPFLRIEFNFNYFGIAWLYLYVKDIYWFLKKLHKTKSLSQWLKSRIKKFS